MYNMQQTEKIIETEAQSIFSFDSIDKPKINQFIYSTKTVRYQFYQTKEQKIPKSSKMIMLNDFLS